MGMKQDSDQAKDGNNPGSVFRKDNWAHLFLYKKTAHKKAAFLLN